MQQRRSVPRRHGTRAKYVVERCRCEACRKANADYQRNLVRRNAYCESSLVDARKAREHVLSLLSSGRGKTDGMGWRRVARLAGVSPGVVERLIYGAKGRPPSRRILRVTEAKLLGVRRSPEALAPRATVDAAPVWRMVEEISSLGVPKARVARALGKKTPALQLSKARVTVRNARAVADLHWALWRRSGKMRETCRCRMPPEIRAWLEEQ